MSEGRSKYVPTLAVFSFKREIGLIEYDYFCIHLPFLKNR